jgi:hypothetical protein
MGCVDSLIDTESATAWEIPVLVLAYHPIDGDVIDINVTGDWGESLAVTRRKVDSLTTALAASLSDGTKYRAYANDGAQPSLHYQVVGTEERLQPLPTWAKPGHTVPMTDYRAIAEAFDVVDWVERRGVKEIWLWGYHGGVVDLWESNMAGPWGDISNSDRDPEDEWSSLLFWGKFVGSDVSHRIIDPRCGWSHYPPNGEHDYDWGCSSLGWFRYWTQNIPGAGNDMEYEGRPLTNWWRLIGDFDGAMREDYGLVSKP